MGHARPHLHPLLPRTCLVDSLRHQPITRWLSRRPHKVLVKLVKPQHRCLQVLCVCVSWFVRSHVYVRVCVRACLCEHMSIGTTSCLRCHVSFFMCISMQAPTPHLPLLLRQMPMHARRNWNCARAVQQKYLPISSSAAGFCMILFLYRVAKTHRMPSVACHFSQKSH